jgi:glycosyltransferase involved in cell wall biosynthesis
MSSMKCVLIGPVYPYRGGIAHYTTMLYRAMLERKHTVLLVSFKRQYPQWLFPGRSDRDPSAEPLQVDSAHYWIDSLNPLSWLNTFRHIRRHQPDVLVMQWWTTFWSPVWFVLGLLNQIFLQKPLVYICHNVLPHEARWWDPWLVRLVLRWGKRFVVQSMRERERLLTLLPGACVDIVPHPTYDMFADQRIPREDARRQLGLPQDLPVLLFFGIVREYKGLGDLLQALPAIRSSLGKVILVVAGEFWDDKLPYLEMIEQLHIGDSVVIVDRYIGNEEVGVYFSAADVVVAPYRRGTGSGAVQLAHGFGTPVIATEVCVGDPYLVMEAGGLVIPPEGPKALAEATLRFFQKQGQIRVGSPTVQNKERVSWHSLVSRIEAASETDCPPENRPEG